MIKYIYIGNYSNDFQSLYINFKVMAIFQKMLQKLTFEYHRIH